MEEKQLGGICIGTRQRGDNDKMLSVFCEDGCVYDVLARGALKPKYKLKFAAQLFSACDYFLCPSRAGYYILGGATFGELSLLSLSSDPDVYAAACLVCETAKKSVLGENVGMYAETVAALGELAAGNARCELVALRILCAAFSYNGWGVPDLKYCREILSAPAGNVSAVSADAEEARRIIKTLASRFASRFEKLNSLAFFSL